MSELTQRQLVLDLLSDGAWHSSIEFISEGVLRAAARVFELRQRGFAIETRRVARPGRAPVFEYRLPQAVSFVDRVHEALREVEAAASDAEQLSLGEEELA